MPFPLGTFPKNWYKSVHNLFSYRGHRHIHRDRQTDRQTDKPTQVKTYFLAFAGIIKARRCLRNTLARASSMTVCRSPCYTSIIHCFSSPTSRILFWALLKCFQMLQSLDSDKNKAASYLARWILRFHIQYAIKIGSDCNFLSFTTCCRKIRKVRWRIFVRMCIKFHQESDSERILKIGLHLPKLLTKKNQRRCFLKHGLDTM